MASSSKKIQDKDGFETWLVRPKPKKSKTAPKKVLGSDNTKISARNGKKNALDGLPATVGSKGMKRTGVQAVQNEVGGIGKKDTSSADGTVVITEEEYRMLLSLKLKTKELGLREEEIVVGMAYEEYWSSDPFEFCVH